MQSMTQARANETKNGENLSIGFARGDVCMMVEEIVVDKLRYINEYTKRSEADAGNIQNGVR